jgi:hypothetical protein
MIFTKMGLKNLYCITGLILVVLNEFVACANYTSDCKNSGILERN